MIRPAPAADEAASPPTMQKGKVFAVVAALLVVFVCILLSGSPDPAGDGPANSSAARGDGRGVAAEDGPAAASSPTTPPAPQNWAYTTDVDKVRGGTSYFASTTSTNTVAQDPPYDADTTMRMTVRRMPSSGTDVVLTISSGQMMCPSYEGCSGTVRFDSGPAQRVRFNGPADNSSDTIFVVGAKGFISKLKKAKKVVVEKTLYEAGQPQFEFDVAGLRWSH